MGPITVRITANQSQQVINALTSNVNWDEIDFEEMGLQDSIIRNSKEAGRRLMEFLKDGGQAYSHKWREDENGIIRLRVVSDGTTGKGWIKYFEENDYNIGDYAKSILLSPDFKPTNGVVYEIAIMIGSLFSAEDRTTKKIRAEASRRQFTKPHAEVACLIRKNFSDDDIKAMGLYWIIVMHEPIEDSDGDPFLLSAGRVGGGRWLSAYFDKPDDRWVSESGFAFAVSASVCA